jgi:Tannase and feruloyl esterase
MAKCGSSPISTAFDERPAGVEKNSRRAGAITIIVLLSFCVAASNHSEAAVPKPLKCEDSIKMRFKPDTLTSVVAVKAFKKGDPLVMSEPVTQFTPKAANDLCMIKLNVGPGNPGPADAPSTSAGIGIEVWLPTPANWNGRLHNIGGRGGYDGGSQGSAVSVGWPYAAATAGNEGAVSASTDSGHSLSNGSWGMDPDGTLSRALWTDFAHRAQHEMALKTKALTTAYYGRTAAHAYYEGASTGGRHGYMLAQRYPQDYDGIIANLPTIYFSNWSNVNAYKNLVVQRDLDGVPLTEEQQDIVSNAAIRACDLVGGEHLGYIFDNAACHYDPTKDLEVLCKADGGNNTTKDCVTKTQASLVNKIWYGITVDGSVPSPSVDNGAGVALGGKHLWYGFMRGTSLYLAYFTKRSQEMIRLLGGGGAGRAGSASGGAARSAEGGDQVALELQNPTLAGPSFKNASGNGEGLWTQLSYTQFANAFARGIALDPVLGSVSSSDPDLSAFKAHGGKFLSWHGWNDESIPVQQSMRYYDSVVDKMGGLANVQSFFKLYLIPGGGHTSPQGTSNPDANPPAVAGGQFYKLMIDWVEKGIAPDRIEIKSPSDKFEVITQPICPYPQKATYTQGNPRVTSSFTCS